jgi:hypothetical protein
MVSYFTKIALHFQEPARKTHKVFHHEQNAIPQPNKPIQNHNLLQPLVFATTKQRTVLFPKILESSLASPDDMRHSKEALQNIIPVCERNECGKSASSQIGQRRGV